MPKCWGSARGEKVLMEEKTSGGKRLAIEIFCGIVLAFSLLVLVLFSAKNVSFLYAMF